MLLLATVYIMFPWKPRTTDKLLFEYSQWNDNRLCFTLCQTLTIIYVITNIWLFLSDICIVRIFLAGIQINHGLFSSFKHHVVPVHHHTYRVSMYHEVLMFCNYLWRQSDCDRNRSLQGQDINLCVIFIFTKYQHINMLVYLGEC